MGTKYFYNQRPVTSFGVQRMVRDDNRITPVAVGSIAESNMNADGAPHEHKREVARRLRQEARKSA